MFLRGDNGGCLFHSLTERGCYYGEYHFVLNNNVIYTLHNKRITALSEP